MTVSQQGNPVLLVLSAEKDCSDSQAFAKVLAPVQRAFGAGLTVLVFQGVNRPRENNPPELLEALAHFGYEKEPGDGGTRGHFPSGAIYKDGHEIFRLPSDSQLATMSSQTLADKIAQATDLAYDKQALLARGSVVKGNVDT